MLPTNVLLEVFSNIGSGVRVTCAGVPGQEAAAWFDARFIRRLRDELVRFRKERHTDEPDLDLKEGDPGWDPYFWVYELPPYVLTAEDGGFFISVNELEIRNDTLDYFFRGYGEKAFSLALDDLVQAYPGTAYDGQIAYMIRDVRGGAPVAYELSYPRQDTKDRIRDFAGRSLQALLRDMEDGTEPYYAEELESRFPEEPFDQQLETLRYLYACREYIGEELLDRTVRRLVNAVRQEDPEEAGRLERKLPFLQRPAGETAEEGAGGGYRFALTLTVTDRKGREYTYRENADAVEPEKGEVRFTWRLDRGWSLRGDRVGVILDDLLSNGVNLPFDRTFYEAYMVRLGMEEPSPDLPQRKKYLAAVRRNRTRFFNRVEKEAGTKRKDVRRIRIENEFSAWGKERDFIGRSDPGLVALAKKLCEVPEEDKPAVREAMRAYIDAPCADRTGVRFATETKDIRYRFTGDIDRLAANLTAGTNLPAKTAGREIKVYDLVTKEYENYAVYDLTEGG